MHAWSPSSWQSKHAAQQPVYPDAAALRAVLQELATLPPLVSSWEIESLKSKLASASRGEQFLLQGGDCAETFDDCESTVIANKLKILLQMSLVLVHGLRKPVIRVGRFAGQYAKPRSNDTETRQTPDGEITLPAYRGDIVNRIDFTAASRTPDPQNLLRAYERSALTLNFIRALIDGGFADLHHPEYWDLEFVKHSSPTRAAEYQHIVEQIGRSLCFMETLAGQTIHDLTRVDFFTSHEGLHLLYEQAQTRQVPRREGWYNLSTHFPWIGMRTAPPANGANISAHVEYFRGIRNPIAVKIGPSPQGESPEQTRERITALLDVLHPDNEPGRLTIIHRFGAHEIARCLPTVIEAVQKSRKAVLWVCDPMHGNTQTVSATDVTDRTSLLTPGHAAPNVAMLARPASTPVKTRKFEHILAELEQAFELHNKMGTCLGGVHFELTGENVTECTGGARNVSEADLARAYKSQVDPRLNYEQSLEMAMHIARRG